MAHLFMIFDEVSCKRDSQVFEEITTLHAARSIQAQLNNNLNNILEQCKPEMKDKKIKEFENLYRSYGLYIVADVDDVGNITNVKRERLCYLSDLDNFIGNLLAERGL